MSFLEKNLENIIYKERDFCQARGLHLEPYEFRTYRQLNLAPYGIADLIEIGVNKYEEQLRVRIIECKRNTIDLATYGQASRYQSALSRILGCCSNNYVFEKALIGQRIDARGDFWHIVANDPHCDVYTYEYHGDGIHFKKHYNYPQAGSADAQDIYRPTVEEFFKVAAYLQPRREGGED